MQHLLARLFYKLSHPVETMSRTLTYEEFLLTPASFVQDLELIFVVKQKYGLDFTKEERVLMKYIRMCRLQAIAKYSKNKE